MFEVGQKYRILKPFETGKRSPNEMKGLVGTCIEILGVDGVEAWFHEYDDGQKDWLFPSDVKIGCVELVEEEDFLKQKLDEYGFYISGGVVWNVVWNNEYKILKTSDEIVINKNLPIRVQIRFPESDLEQIVVALMALMEDK